MCAPLRRAEYSGPGSVLYITEVGNAGVMFIFYLPCEQMLYFALLVLIFAHLPVCLTGYRKVHLYLHVKVVYAGGKARYFDRVCGEQEEVQTELGCCCSIT